MSSETEGRVLLAYTQGSVKSPRAAASAFEVCFETLRQRHLGKLSKQERRPATCKLTATKEGFLVKRILDLVHNGFPPQQAIIKDIANIILRNRNPAKPQTVGQKWVYNFVKRSSQLSSIYNRKFDY